MVVTKKVQQIDLKELIKDKLSAYDIYRYIIGHEFKFNMSVRSPLPGHRNGDNSLTKSSYLYKK